MKNKFFYSILYGLTFALAILFLFLFFSLINELSYTESIKQIHKKEVFYAIKLSFFTATISAFLSIAIAIPISYNLSRFNFKGKDIINTLFDLTNVLSPIAIGAVVLIFFNSKIGKFVETNIASFVFEIKGIILAQFFVIIGYAIRFLKNNFDSVDRDYENIARTLGANSFNVFLKITLPLSLRGIISSFLFVWARAMGEFGATIMIAGATTMKTETLPIAIFLSFESADIYSAIVFIFILISISLVILFITRKLLRFKIAI